MGKDLAVCIPKPFNYFADTSCHQGGKKTTPSVYGRYPKDFTHQKGEYKAEDYSNFLHHYSLPLFYQNLDPTVFKVWKHFAYGATLSMKIEIDEHDIGGAEMVFVTFLT